MLLAFLIIDDNYHPLIHAVSFQNNPLGLAEVGPRLNISPTWVAVYSSSITLTELLVSALQKVDGADQPINICPLDKSMLYPVDKCKENQTSDLMDSYLFSIYRSPHMSLSIS